MIHHAQRYSVPQTKWNLLLCCIGTLEPRGSFFSVPFPDWEEGFYTNALLPLLLLAKAVPYAEPNALVVFFAGTNPNKPAKDLSAYHLAKITLIAATEQLSSESSLRFVCLGPGFVNTKIHPEKTDRKGTSIEEIYRLLKYCLSAPKEKLGCNIHIRDKWSEGRKLRCEVH